MNNKENIDSIFIEPDDEIEQLNEDEIEELDFERNFDRLSIYEEMFGDNKDNIDDITE